MPRWLASTNEQPGIQTGREPAADVRGYLTLQTHQVFLLPDGTEDTCYSVDLGNFLKKYE